MTTLISTDGRPVWLLDVDGVLNATRAGWSSAPRRGSAHAAGQSWTIRWAPQLITRIRALTGRVDIRWCSTWCPYADQLEALWSLPELGRAWTSELGAWETEGAKAAAARDVLADGRRLIWTDDTETPIPAHPMWAELTGTGRALLIRPESRYGLRPEHMDTIDAFIA